MGGKLGALSTEGGLFESAMVKPVRFWSRSFFRKSYGCIKS